MKKWLRSSQDPTKVSETIKGLVLALSSVIIFVGTSFFGLNLQANDIADLAGYVGTLAGAIFAVKGAVMKLVMWYGTIKEDSV